MSEQRSLGEVSESKPDEKQERTILGLLPEGWNSDLVENCFNLRNGSARDGRSPNQSSSETEGEYDVYGANGKIAEYHDSNLERGLIIGRVGTVGSVYKTKTPVWVSDNAIKSELDSDNNLDFLYYVLKRSRLDSLANQTAHPLLNQSNVGSTRIPLPPLSEQEKIASVLYNVDQAIQKTEEIIEQTQRVKKGLMQDLFTEGYYDHETESHPLLNTVPTEWEVVTVGDLAEKVQYGISDSLQEEGEYPIFRMNNYENGYMRDHPMKYIDLDDDEFEKYKVEKGDILFNRTNSLELVGKTGIFELEGDYVFASYLVRVRTNEKADPYYLNYYMNSEAGQKRLKTFATKGVSQANINANSLQKLKVPLPPVEEQKKIAEVIKDFDNRIEKAKQEKESLQRIKKGLMQDLLTGEVRTNDKNIEILEEVKA